MSFDPVSYLIGKRAGEGGGGGVTVEPLSVAENGVYNAPSGKAYSPVTVNVPNPNYVETVSGTADNPWGGLNPVEVQNEYQSDNSTVYAYVDGTPVGGVPTHAYMGRWGSAIGFYSIAPGSAVSSWYGVWVSYNTNGTISTLKILGNGEVIDATPYASLLPMTITIIHHPLPEDNT